MKTEIKKLMQEIHENNVNKGFWEDKETKNVGEVLMLCVSELSEALEAHRKGRFADVVQFNQDRQSTPFHEESATIEAFKRNIKDTFEDEIADTVIRLFDLSEGFGIDLERHIRLKLEYNRTRPYKHAKAY